MKGFEFDESIWHIVDGKWRCVERTIKYDDFHSSHDIPSACLFDFLFYLGFEVPSNITFALAETSEYKLKFRQFGGCIHLFIRPNKWI